MMNSYKQYFPNFFDGFTPLVFEFETLEEFLNHPHVKKIASLDDFHKFAICPPENNSFHIMMIYINDSKSKEDSKYKYQWYVFGTLKEDIPELDRWTSEDMKKIDE